MSTLKQLYDRLTAELGGGNIESPGLEARFILKHRLGAEWADIIGDPDRPVPETATATIQADVSRRLAGEPLSRIHGVRQFHGLDFIVTPDTLDPRPDTETLVDVALKMFHGKQFPKTLLDLGTGTGCILITLLKHWPDARGTAIDISPEALKVAEQNAKIHGVADQITFKQGSWTDGIEGKFDLIVSNPPYIPESDIQNLDKEVRNHDPILALSGGFDGLDPYKKIFSDLNRLLTPSGKGLFEIGLGQAEGIARLGRESRIRVNCTHPDFGGIPRVVEISSGDN